MTGDLVAYPAYRPSSVEWLGDVPEHWEVSALKWYSRCQSGNGLPAEEVLSEPLGERCIPAIGGNGLMGFAGRANCNARVLAIGRVGALCGNVHMIEHPAWITDNALVLSVQSDSASLEYIAGVLRARNLNDIANKTAQPLITGTGVLNERIPLPPLPEQAAIVRYLDHVGRRIRRYVSAKRKLIALLEEEKQAVINQAVTRGLDPNVRLKPSGVEWLGAVPEHWEVQRLGHLLQERGEINNDGHVSDVLSLLRDRGVIPYSEKGNIGNKRSDDITRYKIVRPDDIVVNCMNVIIGSVGLSTYTGCLSPVYYVLTRRSEDDNPQYLNAYFQTKPFQQSLVRIGNGILAHRMRIPMELLKCEPFPRPPAEEQAAIVGYLDKATADIDGKTARARRQIELVEEYRTRLIADVVTGKLDVREAAAELPVEPDDADGTETDGAAEDVAGEFARADAV